MSKPIHEPYIEIAGQGAESLERELQELFQAEWGAPGRRIASPAQGAPREGEKIDTDTAIKVAGLLLAVPPSIRAGLEVAERLKLTERVKRLVAWAKAKKQDKPSVRISLVSPQGRSVELDRAEPGEVVEALTERDADGAPKGRAEK